MGTVTIAIARSRDKKSKKQHSMVGRRFGVAFYFGACIYVKSVYDVGKILKVPKPRRILHMSKISVLAVCDSECQDDASCFASAPRRYFPDHYRMIAIKQLIAVIIISLVRCEGRKPNRHQRDDFEWVISNDAQPLYAFLNVCDALGYDVALWRARILAIGKNPHDDKRMLQKLEDLDNALGCSLGRNHRQMSERLS